MRKTWPLLSALLMMTTAIVAEAQSVQPAAPQPAIPLRGSSTAIDPAAQTTVTSLPKEGDHGETVFALQVALDRARFSPGAIDGHFGRSTRKALAAYQESQGAQVTSELDDELWSKLVEADKPALVHISVDAADLGPVGKALPAKAEDLVGRPALSYGSLAEAVSEKFHVTQKALAALNPGVEIVTGADVIVPNVEGAVATPSTVPVGGPLATRAPVEDSAVEASPSPDADAKWQATLTSLSVDPSQPAAARLAVDKSANEVRVYDGADRLIAAFPATVGSNDNPSPVGDLTINGVSHNPSFKYDTDVLGEKGPKKQFILAAGPNNLVGVVWIDLSKPHNGIHGTSEPQNIGQRESHGCVRLTNWDAARLAQMVQPGTPITFQ